MPVQDDENNDFYQCLVQAAKWIPVLFILLIIFWSYYAYVVEVCISTIETLWKQVTYLIIFHLSFAMFMWSYWQTVFTKSNCVPDKFKLPDYEYETLMHAETEEMQKQILENFSNNLPNYNRTLSGSVRYCDKCQQVKPDRTHHCSVCATCILKMDHHCPWVNNCIGFKNYKFFVLFLAYALIHCLFVAGTIMQYVITYWHGGKFQILFLFFVALMFAISLISLFTYHCFLVLHNRTTLEAFRAPIFAKGPDKEAYNLGKSNNFQEVFGDEACLWFFPIGTSLGCGYDFPRHLKPDDSEHLLSTHDYLEDEERSDNWLS